MSRIVKKAMDKQIPMDDIRRVTSLLSGESLARIEAAKWAAAADLTGDLSEYWKSRPLSRACLRANDAADLVPFFEAYAERQYDSYAEELLPHVSDVDQYTSYLLINVIDAISNE